MVLEVKIGVLRDRLVVEGSEFPLHREGGWIVLPSLGERPGGRVRYDALRDRVHIEGPRGSLDLRFRWRHTTFTWDGVPYRLGPMAWGHVMVARGERPVVTGRVTASGVRFGYVAPEMETVAPELAVGLAYRAVTMWVFAAAAGASH